MESREQGPETQGDLNPEQTLVITSQVSCVCPLCQYVICVSCITSDISDMDQLMSDLMPTLRMSEPLQDFRQRLHISSRRGQTFVPGDSLEHITDTGVTPTQLCH